MTGAVTLGVAPPGTGKSNFSILTGLSIATGQALTGEPVHRAGPVWIHNNEDSLDELYRRVSGVLKLHQIEFDGIRKNIFATSGLDERLVVALKDQDIVKRTKAVADAPGPPCASWRRRTGSTTSTCGSATSFSASPGAAMPDPHQKQVYWSSRFRGIQLFPTATHAAMGQPGRDA
jgi:hypothetical protein